MVQNMALKKIQPPFLKEGDKVAIISPSYCIDGKLLIEAKEFLEKWGLKVHIGRNASKRNGPFAGSDEERLSDLQEMTNDRDIKAVLCSRGGYGLSRIIDKADFSALNICPKWYSGFSDITVLHQWLNEVCGIMSVHGDMPLNFNNAEKRSYNFVTLKKALFGERIDHEWRGNFFNARNVSGEVTGGNLSLIYSLTGTRADISTKGKILIIEEVKEYYYHLDRMLISLKLSGKLKDISALVIGGMTKIRESTIPWGKDVEQTILGIVNEFNYPVLFNFPAGHIADNWAFYIGKEAKIEINGDKAALLYV
jgi:muramoyltetrapeptide carboxypeptidase